MRKTAVWIMIGAVLLTSILAALGSLTVFAVYVVAIGVTGGMHWVRGCVRCTNVACAINPRSPEFVFGSETSGAVPPELEGFSDLDSTRLGIPLLLALLLGLYGVWLFHPLAVVTALMLFAAGFAIYTRNSCSECTNDCPANRNPAYHEWKAQS